MNLEPMLQRFVSRIDAIEDALGDSSRYIAPEQATAIKGRQGCCLGIVTSCGGNEFQGFGVCIANLKFRHIENYLHQNMTRL